jgi:hypothetical protein
VIFRKIRWRSPLKVKFVYRPIISDDEAIGSVIMAANRKSATLVQKSSGALASTPTRAREKNKR